MSQEWIHHHHNSVRFRCECGKLHEHWPRADEPGQTKYDSTIRCSCGRTHWKRRANFRGEGP